MGLFLSRGPQHDLFFLSSLSWPLSFVRPAFFRPDRKMPKPTRAAAVKDGAFLSAAREGLVLDGREHGGML
jgi:hypothetical protein